MERIIRLRLKLRQDRYNKFTELTDNKIILEYARMLVTQAVLLMQVTRKTNMN
jgi:hypothetical protein